MRTISCVAIVGVLASTLNAQDSRVAFEVASVKQNVSGSTTIGTSPALDGLALTNYPLRWLIARAYMIPIPDLPHRVIGGQNRILDAQFDITAKAPPNTSPPRLQLMLQSLLADRFNFRFHRETRDRPVYALVVARPGRLGDELRPSKIDCDVFGEIRGNAIRAGETAPEPPRDAKKRMLCRNDPNDPTPRGALRTRFAGPLSQLVISIQGSVDRPVIDATQLTGSYEWQLTYANTRVPDASAEFPTIVVALEEQLGLKLEPRTMPFEALVIDSIELPTPN